jgi:uncharacterized protein (TIGR02265 family)
MDIQIRGLVLKARKTFVEEHFGAEAWDRVLAALSEQDRGVLKSIVVYAGWYPFEIGEHLDRTIVDVLGAGDSKVFEDIGVQSARQNLTGVHKSFLTSGDPQAFLAQTRTIYKFYYNTGSREYEATGPNSGVITTRDSEIFSLADCLTVIGWHREALTMCGGKNVRIKETKCRAKGDSVCRYELAWELH